MNHSNYYNISLKCYLNLFTIVSRKLSGYTALADAMQYALL